MRNNKIVINCYVCKAFYLKNKKEANGKAFQKVFSSHSPLLLEIQTNQALVIERKGFFTNYETVERISNPTNVILHNLFLPIEWHKQAFIATHFDKDLIFAEMLSH